jgi:hypothetical protein
MPTPALHFNVCFAGIFSLSNLKYEAESPARICPANILRVAPQAGVDPTLLSLGAICHPVCWS